MGQNTRRRATTPALPRDLPALLADGHTLLGQGRPQDAFAHAQAAATMAPNDPAALHLLGVAYLAMGHTDAGCAFLKRAIASEPGLVACRVDLARAMAGEARLDEAVAQYEAASSLAPDDADIRRALAATLLRLDRPAEAERHAAEAARLAPDDALAHEMLARLQYRCHALDAARASAERAVALSPAVAARLQVGVARHTPGGPSRPEAAPRLRAGAGVDGGALAQACRDRDVLLLDDVLDDPLARRAEALAACAGQAERDTRSNFPGAQTPAQPCQPMMQRIADALGHDIKWETPDNGVVRISTAADGARCDIHVDSPTLHDVYAGVLYLSLPEHARGGTSFWRHRATGWHRRPDAAALQAAGYRSFLDFERRNVPVSRVLSFDQWQQQREAAWDLVFEVPMRFNRLIVYRSDFFHAISDLFGDSPDNGRLVQLFHFELAGPPA